MELPSARSIRYLTSIRYLQVSIASQQSRALAAQLQALYSNNVGMTIESLTLETQAVMRRVLAYVATTRQLDDDDFETRLGVERGVLAEILMRWPAVDDRNDDSAGAVAINNALNEVANGLDLSAEEWLQLGVTRTQVQSAYVEWVTSRGWQSTGLS